MLMWTCQSLSGSDRWHSRGRRNMVAGAGPTHFHHLDWVAVSRLQAAHPARANCASPRSGGVTDAIDLDRRLRTNLRPAIEPATTATDAERDRFAQWTSGCNLRWLRWCSPSRWCCAGTIRPRSSDLRALVFDQYQRVAPREYQPVPVKIVDIDDESLARAGQWPWPRTHRRADAGEAARGGRPRRRDGHRVRGARPDSARARVSELGTALQRRAGGELGRASPGPR